jgi:hypothetical protein
MPKDQVFTETISVPAGGTRWYVHTLTGNFTPAAGAEYWFGIKTNFGTQNIRNTVGRQTVSRANGTIIDLNLVSEGFLANNSLYYNGTLPSSFADTQGFGTRDEALILLYR